METETPDLESIKRQLMSIRRPKKPKMLVVDDEPDNLDLLYRTFRRDFSVFKAESGVRALEILSQEGEVAVIISDQRMPEMKGTEFLSKTVPQFPNTVRIILTGFTDIEDLVDAINSGQVYKYITKPWDPNELKTVVQRAAETYELLKLRTEQLCRANSQIQLLSDIMGMALKATEIEETLQAIAKAIGEQIEADGVILQVVSSDSLAPTVGAYGIVEDAKGWLADDPIVSEAIATKIAQGEINIPNNSDLAESDRYKSANIQAHLCTPIIDRNQVVAVFSLQWQKPCQLSPDDLYTVKLVAQEMALVLSRLHQST
ncbi:MAG: response regulator [Limnospira sp. PMC 1291.21]|uniref:Response regulator receiver modulated GAF sensor protein n=2 Tax=Limnospira TaxID=2596745 RepID=B5W902_LIMMA|nr:MULTISPECIES: response regulator [Limnospira]EKD09339.1 response regulator receiver modulated GAF sensor protein [Arthrospira platensis C1]MDC0836593.1 response regulator [Limnoraphis robusta]MDY7054768.1 response regulator [Limnospira fusiformis LS22]EDZ91999.1 response regulator receiver modulated GAF sensor protein [Limnospira maxima CS-328]MDT9178921.1 response regulator [Limnospira sp. PMC 1238.20]